MIRHIGFLFHQSQHKIVSAATNGLVTKTTPRTTTNRSLCTKAQNAANEEQIRREDNKNRDNSENERHRTDEQQQETKKPPKKSFVPATRNPFASSSDKTKQAYMQMVDIFIERSVHRRNHVEFIYAALKHMPEFGVEYDLEVYKALINVLPKGKFIPRNVFQAEFMHYPKQQQCVIDLLEQMEDLGVMPDTEMEAMLLNVFGRSGHPLRKYWRMMYWMPKFRNLSPWPLPNPVPDDTLTIAKLAVERMCTVDVRSEVNVFDTKDVKDAIDHTWVVSGQSVDQRNLLKDHPRNKALYIEGPFLIWLRNRTIHYFTLRADPDVEYLKTFNEKKGDQDDVTNLKIPFFDKVTATRKYQVGKVRSVHQQDDGTIFAICATGTSTKDSLLSWIRLLEANGNKSLGEIPVLFRFHSRVGEKAVQIEGQSDTLQTPVSSSDADSKIL